MEKTGEVITVGLDDSSGGRRAISLGLGGGAVDSALNPYVAAPLLLLLPLLGLLAGYATIGIFPFFIAISAAAMLLFSERLNVFFGKQGTSRNSI